jgi:hypothetical protein
VLTEPLTAAAHPPPLATPLPPPEEFPLALEGPPVPPAAIPVPLPVEAVRLAPELPLTVPVLGVAGLGAELGATGVLETGVLETGALETGVLETGVLVGGLVAPPLGSDVGPLLPPPPAT